VNKRETFDISEQRIEGTVAENFKDQITDVEKKDHTEWRKQHEDMLEAIKKAKKQPRPASASDPPIQLILRE
jgi:hypothetical protein